MIKPENNLSHSFNIELSEEVITKLKIEQGKISEKFKERRSYDSTPHLSVCNKFITKEDTDLFVEALKNEFGKDDVFYLEFADFKQSETGDYIFLHLSPESEKKMIGLHNRALKVTEKIGTEIQAGKFRHFEYNPHISIIKLFSENVPEALNMIKSDMSGMKMLVSSFYITRQDDDEKGFSNFPTIEKIKLNN
jgi:hypothetical protein